MCWLGSQTIKLNKDLKARNFVLKPGDAVGFVMKATNTTKTSVCADFLLAIIVNYGNNKKTSKRLSLKHLELGI